MDTYTSQPPSVAALFIQGGRLLHDVACRLRKVARGQDDRRAAWKRADDVRRVLDQLTDHELRDIGISRAELQAVRGAALAPCRETVRNLDTAVERMRGC